MSTIPHALLGITLQKDEEVFLKEFSHVTIPIQFSSFKVGAKPRFHRPRPVPYTLHEATEHELDHLESEGITKKISCKNWASPIVAVPKQNASIRIFGDYKVTVNSVLEINHYCLP